MSLALICVGAGRGERFGGDKLAETVAGRTVFELAVSRLVEALPEAPLVIVVAAPRLLMWQSRLQTAYPQARFVPGGMRRQDSVRLGIDAASELGADVVAVHDAARPLVHPHDVRKVVDGLGNAAGAVLCRRLADTVKRVTDGGRVIETVVRDSLRLSLTPQVCRVEALRRAWRQAGPEVEWTDEAGALEAAGQEVRAIEADHPNPKLTTAADLALLRALAEGMR